MQLSWLLFLWHLPDDTTEGVAKHSFLGCNHQSTCMSQEQPLCSPALVWYPLPNVLRRRDEGSGKPCAVDRVSEYWHPLGTRTRDLRVPSLDYTTTAHFIWWMLHQFSQSMFLTEKLNSIMKIFIFLYIKAYHFRLWLNREGIIDFKFVQKLGNVDDHIAYLPWNAYCIM